MGLRLTRSAPLVSRRPVGLKGLGLSPCLDRLAIPQPRNRGREPAAGYLPPATRPWGETPPAQLDREPRSASALRRGVAAVERRTSGCRRQKARRRCFSPCTRHSSTLSPAALLLCPEKRAPHPVFGRRLHRTRSAVSPGELLAAATQQRRETAWHWLSRPDVVRSGRLGATPGRQLLAA
jgi:hypothetical protein